MTSNADVSLKLSMPPLGTFVAPYADETIHSLVARYFTLYEGRYRATILRKLLGPKCITINYGMADYERFVGACPTGIWSSISEFAERHTFVPFFRPFGFTHGRGSSGVDTVDCRLRKTMRSYAAPRPRFCTVCVQEDASELGMPYWHRAHQIRGVTVCHKHQVPLVIVCPRCRWPIDRELDLNLPPGKCRCGFVFHGWQPPVQKGENLQQAIRLAKFAYALLNANLQMIDAATLADFLRSEIVGKEGGAAGGRLTELWHQMQQSYPKAARQELKMADTGTSMPFWIRKLCNESEAGGSAPRKVAILNMLFANFDEFKSALQNFSTTRAGELNVVPLMGTVDGHSSSMRNDLERQEVCPKPRVRREAQLPDEKSRQRDDLMVSRLQSAVDRLKRAPGRPIKLTMNRLRTEARIHHSLDRFPKTMSLLCASRESDEEFARRKLRWAYDELILSGARISQKLLIEKSCTASSPFGRPLSKLLLEEIGAGQS